MALPAGHVPPTALLVTMQLAAHRAPLPTFCLKAFVRAVQETALNAQARLIAHPAGLPISYPTVPAVPVHQTARIVQARPTALFVHRLLLSFKTAFAGPVLPIAHPVVMKRAAQRV